jgi:hypothetical protein
MIIFHRGQLSWNIPIQDALGAQIQIPFVPSRVIGRFLVAVFTQNWHKFILTHLAQAE